MTTNKFIKDVECLGYAILHDYYENLLLIRNEFGDIVADVATDRTYCIRTTYFRFGMLGESEKELLMEILLVYTKTPLDEREVS